MVDGLWTCRVCGKIFPHSVPLLYHFQEIHVERQGYTLEIQRNGKIMHESGMKEDSSHGFPSTRKGRWGNDFSHEWGCRICGQIFSHAVRLLGHFEDIHVEREGYTLGIQRNGKIMNESVMEEDSTFLFTKEGKSPKFPSARKGHAIFRAKVSHFIEMDDARPRKKMHLQSNKDVVEIDNYVDLTRPYINKLDQPLTFGNFRDDDENNLDLNLKL